MPIPSSLPARRAAACLLGLVLVHVASNARASRVFAGTQAAPGGTASVHRHAGGTTWDDLGPVPGRTLLEVWDLEWHDGALWACGLSGFPEAGFVARWDGSWVSWTVYPDGPATSLAVVDGDIRVTGLEGPPRRWDGSAWRTYGTLVTGMSRSLATPCGTSPARLFMGDNFGDTFWAWDPAQLMACNGYCGAAIGTLCPAGCHPGSCVYSFAWHDDGTGATAYAGAFEGQMYRWDEPSRMFEPHAAGFAGHVQALASTGGNLLAGTSNGRLMAQAPGLPFVTALDFGSDFPVSALEVDPVTGLLWIGHGGVPFGEARHDGTSGMRTWDGTNLVQVAAPGSLDGGVVAILAAPEPPCDAGPPQVVECAGALTPVTLSALVGPCDEPATWTWTGDFVEGTAVGETVTVHFSGVGAHDPVLSNGFSSCSTHVVVQDTLPPSVSLPPDARVECPDPVPRAAAVAGDACDPSPAVAVRDVVHPGPCPQAFTIERIATATDAAGLTATATQWIDVVDETPPSVAASAGIVAVLWPPNHRMVPFTQDDVPVVAVDACGGPVTWRFDGCASDEPEDELGDGRFAPDCVVASGGTSFAVRAERQGTGDGRRYSVTIVAVDACGNASPPTLVGTIDVPHDRR